MVSILRKRFVAQVDDTIARFMLPILMLLILMFPSPGETASWTLTSPMYGARAGHTATLLLNGKVLVTGGFYRYWYVGSAELYNPVTGTWSGAGSGRRASHRVQGACRHRAPVSRRRIAPPAQCPVQRAPRLQPGLA